MYKVLLLASFTGLWVSPLGAQTVPPTPTEPATPAAPVTPTAPAKDEKSPWLIFDQPLDSLPASRSKVAREKPLRDKPVRTAALRQTSASGTSTNKVEATQGANYVPLDADTYRLLDRYAIKFGADSLGDPHTSARPYTRAAAARLGERMLSPDGSTTRGGLSGADRFNAEYLLKDNWANSSPGAEINASEKPLLTNFYRNQTDLYHVQTEDFTLRVNPVLLLQAGRDNQISGLRYVNTRGVKLEGTIDQRLGFYAFLTDNQEAVPGWVQQRIRRDSSPSAPVAPHEGYTKDFKTSGSAYDFFTARGGITYAATKHINVQLAHDRNFIGNGYRSLILSDYSAPYFFLKLNTRVWKFNYQNIFAELNARRSLNGLDSLYPKKYLVLHHLSLDVTNNFNIGVFESEVSGGRGRGLELQYLNPVIFYRAIEQQVGSTDNALLGIDFKWNIKRRAQLYGQLVLDEFKVKEVFSGAGWWANKQAFQLGGKLLDVAGVRNLDLQLEFNYIRPYTYQHENEFTDYQHYQQPLAHPMGANLTEILGVLSYQPLPRLNLVGKFFYTVQGLDVRDAAGNLINYGGNPLLSYNSHPMDYGNRTGQGDKQRLLHLDFTATYQPRLNLFLDATLISRSNRTESLTSSGYVESYASLALRWNIAQRLHEF